MLKKLARVLVAGCALLGASLAIAATVPDDRLVEKYTPLAGSESNAKALVTGLRDGSDIKLTSTSPSGATTTTTIDPPTGKMGWGNVNIALALAEASLKEQGITNPTPEQLKAALNGGTITDSSGKTVQISGVLQMRAEGKGWGQIAQALGFKLGEVMRSAKADGAGKSDQAGAKSERVSNVEKVDRPDKPERPEKPERPVRPDKPERPSR